MRIWLSKSSEVSLRDQLQAQIILGIVSNDVKPGQRLPSIRELARRHKIHSNTVSAAYRRLSKMGWVDTRKGSGVYARARSVEQSLPGTIELDQLISSFLKRVREKGFSLREIQEHLGRWFALQPPDHFLLVEPDAELRRILLAEIEEATGWKAIGIGLDDYKKEVLAGAVLLTLYSHAENVRALLPPDTDLVTMRSRSVPESMSGNKRPPAGALIAVVSRWIEFLRWSQTMLVAAGVDPEALSLRDARKRGWEKGLRSAALVITDSQTASRLPPGVTPRIFRIISDASLAELRAFVQSSDS
jgi:DNA-binding transcriptional regulator YhcF (GntR family)